MNRFRGLISENTLKELGEWAVICGLLYEYGLVRRGILNERELKKEIEQYKQHIKSGRAGQYVKRLLTTKEDWEIEIPPETMIRTDRSTEI